MFLLIALFHAIPVLVVGLGSNSRSRTIGAALFMAAIGLLTGNPAYMVVDLLAVGIALAYCLSRDNEKTSANRPPESYEPRPPAISPTNATSRVNSSAATPANQQMGLSSAMRLSFTYDKRIRAYGLEPKEFPPELHATICSSFERRSEQFANMSQLAGAARREYIEASLEAAADLLVLCGIGPDPYDDMRIGVRASEVIEELARTWIADGPAGSIELQLMDEVNQSGNLNLDFATAFKRERSRQNERKQAERLATIRAGMTPRLIPSKQPPVTKPVAGPKV